MCVKSAGVPVAYVRLADFSDGAGDELSHVVKQRLKGGAKAVVLDLRGNGGGLLNEAVKAASVFIPEGPIVSTDGRTRPRHVFKATGDAISTKVPVVVLVDEGTASAAEIVAGALAGPPPRAGSSGTRTFGKGVFQEIEPLSNGGALDITVGEYFTPSRAATSAAAGPSAAPDSSPNVVVRQPTRSHATRRSRRASRLLAHAVHNGE